jgi:hypothetical protein
VPVSEISWTNLKVSAAVLVRLAILTPYNNLSTKVEDVTIAAQLAFYCLKAVQISEASNSSVIVKRVIKHKIAY